MATSNPTEKRRELVDFLKRSSIFKVLDLRILEGISPVFTELHYGPGQIIFKQGDPADAVYIVKDGSIEVIQGEPPKILAYLTAGECFGEMALIHETARTATIRVPESAAVIRVPKAALQELRTRFPEVTSAVADIINHRLAGTLPFQAPGLQGNLAFFDLATVIQTVIASRQAGVLILFGRSGKAVAELIMKDGAISYATFKHLRGEMAVLELMTRNDTFDFIFERKDVSKRPLDAGLNKKPPHMLLIEGARRADELPKLMINLGWPYAIFGQGNPVDEWNGIAEDSVNIGPQVWPLMGDGCTIEEITQKVPYDRYSTLLILDEMVRRGHAKKESAAASQHEKLEKTQRLPTQAAPEFRKESKPESKLKPSPEPMKLVQGPAAAVAAVNSINAVTSNLATIIGKNEVRFVLNQALCKASDKDAALTSLKVDPEQPTLDLRYASPEFYGSDKTAKSLENLMRIFLDIASKSQKLTD